MPSATLNVSINYRDHSGSQRGGPGCARWQHHCWATGPRPDTGNVDSFQALRSATKGGRIIRQGHSVFHDTSQSASQTPREYDRGVGRETKTGSITAKELDVGRFKS